MKDYLKYPLSQEERDLITSIIWITAKSYKQRLYKRNRHQLIQFDDVDIPVEDEYDFFSLKTRGTLTLQNLLQWLIKSELLNMWIAYCWNYRCMNLRKH